MGAKTSLISFCHGDKNILTEGDPDIIKTNSYLSRLIPGASLQYVGDSKLAYQLAPDEDLIYASSVGGTEFAVSTYFSGYDLPQLEHTVRNLEPSGRCAFASMSSIVGGLTFGVWEDRVLLRYLKVDHEYGIHVDLGSPLPFEWPFWNGQRSKSFDLDDLFYGDPNGYVDPLKFSAMEMGEEALRSLFGFVIEGFPVDGDIDLEMIPVFGFRIV